MGLHLIKMAAGITSLAELQARQDYLRSLPPLSEDEAAPQNGSAIAEAGKKKSKKQARDLMHVTRYFPRRADEILKPLEALEEGGVEGSLYWVFQKRIQARQKIAAFREVAGSGGETRCGIVLSGPLVPTVMSPKKAFQGWRYLTAEDAPDDLCSYFTMAEDIPPQMRQDLLELCLI